MQAGSGDSVETSQLLSRASAGDESAIDALFARHLPGVKQSVRRRLRPVTQPRFDASDVVQETHERARRYFSDYLQQRPMPFHLWLLRTAHQRIVDFERAHLHAGVRSLDREIPLPDASSVELARHLLADRESPSDKAILREQAAVVRRCLAELPETDREVLLLRIFDDLRNADVALLLKLPETTTKKRFTRALLKLRQLLCAAGLDRELGP